MAQAITTPMLIPKDILSSEEQKVYEQFKDQPAELEKRFKWWSMHDLMKYFHSGLMTKENDANMFSFQIDLTGPELDANSLRNPQLLTNLNTAMANLSKITNEISTDFNEAQSANAAQSTQLVLNATARKNGGKKKNLRGGDYVPPKINEKYSADRLKTECFTDIKLDTFGSRDRFFVVDGNLPVAQEALKNQIASPAPTAPTAPAPVLNLGPVPEVTQVGGKKYKTRKGRQHGKKRKTHRRRR